MSTQYHREECHGLDKHEKKEDRLLFLAKSCSLFGEAGGV